MAQGGGRHPPFPFVPKARPARIKKGRRRRRKKGMRKPGKRGRGKTNRYQDWAKKGELANND